MQEHRMHVHFNKDATIIHFLSDHLLLAGLSFQVTVLRRLSFLQCEFLVPDPLLTDGTEVTFPTFLVVEQTLAIWHCQLGHLGINATHTVLTKDYTTGVNWSGSIDFPD